MSTLQAMADKLKVSQPEDKLHSMALQAFREDNTSMPLVEGQQLKGTVIRLDRKTVWIDVGLGKHAKIFR